MTNATDKNIRIRIRDPKLFIPKSIRTVTISVSKGIESEMGKLKSPTEGQDGTMVVQSYLFTKTKWSVSDSQDWVKQNKKELMADDPSKGMYADAMRAAPPNWMLYLSEPYALRLWNRETSVIVKSIKLTKHMDELLWLCSADKTYGIMIMSDPKAIPVADFGELEWRHGLTDADRRRYWPRADVLYMYDAYWATKFDEPMRYRKPKGFQLFHKGNPQFIKSANASVSNSIQVDFAPKSLDVDTVEKLSDVDLMCYHSKMHNTWDKFYTDTTVLSSDGTEINEGELKGLHDQIAYIMVQRKYSHNSISDLDKEEVEYEESPEKSTYNCECIKCGYKMSSNRHCAELKCDKCGGQMRRAERPGPGKSDDDKSKDIIFT